MAKSNKKYTQIGALIEGQYGPFIALGNPEAKNPKYSYNVEVRVKDSAGNVVAQLKNPRITLIDPRKKTDKEGNPRKVSNSLVSEAFLVSEE